MKYKYGVMPAYAQKCTRRTHAVSCGWTNVHDMMRNESYIRTQRTSTSKLLHAPCSYKHWAATASLLLGIFSGLFLVSSQGPFAPFRCLDWKPRVPLQCNLGNLENIYNVTWGTLRTFTWNPWEAWEPWEPWGTEATFTMQPWQSWERLLGNLENLERTFRL